MALSSTTRRFVAFQAMSILGDRIAQVSVPLALLILTGSPGAAGLAAAANQLPGFLLATLAGSIVDRKSKKLLSVGSDIARSILYVGLGVLFLSDSVSVYPVIATMFVIGVFDTISGVAHFAWLPLLAKDEELLRANELVEGSDAGVTLIGPPLGGALLDLAGRSIGIFANAATFAVSAVGLSRLPPDAPTRVEGEVANSSLMRGFQVIWVERTQKGVQLMLAATYITTAALVLIVLSLGREQLSLSSTEASLAVSGAGVGGLVASLAIAPRIRNVPVRRVCSLTYATIAAAIVGIAFSPSLIGLIMGMLVADAAITLTFIMLGTLRQALTTESLLGIIGGTSASINALLGTVSVALAGLALDSLDQRTAAALWALPMLLAVVGILSFDRGHESLRVISRRAESTEEPL